MEVDVDGTSASTLEEDPDSGPDPESKPEEEPNQAFLVNWISASVFTPIPIPAPDPDPDPDPTPVVMPDPDPPISRSP